MCYFVIELEEAVRSQANFLEMLENRTPILIRNFGAESAKVAEHLKTVVEYKIELINRERKLEKQIASNNGVNLAEPVKVNSPEDIAAEVIEVIEAVQYDINSCYASFNKAEILSYIPTIKHNDKEVLQAVRSHFVNIASKLK